MQIDDRQFVKLILDETGLTQKWLVKRFWRKGIAVNPASLSAALTGKRKGSAMDELIQLSLDELKYYRLQMERSNDG